MDKVYPSQGEDSDFAGEGMWLQSLGRQESLLCRLSRAWQTAPRKTESTLAAQRSCCPRAAMPMNKGAQAATLGGRLGARGIHAGKDRKVIARRR